MSLRDTLKGTGVAIVTPFDQNGAVDFNALDRLIEYLIGGDIDYLVSLGTTGEAPTLSRKEKIAIIEFTYQKVANRIPVVVGIGGNNTRELVADLESYPLQEAAAVLSASPYYNKPSQEGIFQHYKMLAKASPKPILLYNVPARTGRNIAANTAIRLANEVDNIAGLKEAGGDMAQCMQILRDRPAEFLVVSGDDALALPQIACGMDGVISVAANCFPREFSHLVRLCLAGDFPAAKRINDSMIAAYDILFTENNPAGAKAFLAKKGLIENILRLPNVPLSKEVYGRVEEYLRNAGANSGVLAQ